MLCDRRLVHNVAAWCVFCPILALSPCNLSNFVANHMSARCGFFRSVTDEQQSYGVFTNLFFLSLCQRPGPFP